MNKLLSAASTLLCIFVVTLAFGAGPSTKCDSLAAVRPKVMAGDVEVAVSHLRNKVMKATGLVLIQATAGEVWSVLTDYEHLEDFIPGMLESHLLKDKGAKKLIEQTGKTGILFFKKTSTITLKVKEYYLRKIHFKQDSGDFKIFEGEWQLIPCPDTDGTFLSYHVAIKPNFFAPPALTRYVEERDLPKILLAIRHQAESHDGVVRD